MIAEKARCDVGRSDTMKKLFICMAAMMGIALMLAACDRNAVSDSSDDMAAIREEDRTDIQHAEELGESDDVLTEPGDETEPEDELEVKEETGGQTEMKMNVQIGDYNFTATLENNVAVEELLDMMKEGPVTIQMDDYSGFEKVGPLGRSLTTSNSQTTTSAGDIVLYNGNNIVMFYGSNSWSYTRIGKIEDLSDWEKALGSGSITAVFTLVE